MRVTFGVLAAAAAMVSVSGAAQAQARAAPPMGDGYCAPVVRALDPDGDGDLSDQDVAAAARAADACIAADAPQGLVSRAAVHVAAGRSLKAMADVDAALAAAPEYAPALRMKCDLVGDTSAQQARPFCDRAVAAAPGWARARASQAAMRAATGDAVGATQALDEAVRLDSTWGQPLILRAMMKFQRGDHAGTEADLTASQAAEPRPGNLLILGNALESMGAHDGAIGLYGAMLQTWPRHPGILRARAELLLKTGNFDGAIPDLTALTELQPRDGWAFATRGSVYANKGDIARAEADIRKAAAVDAEPGQWLVLLARVQSATGHAADARATIDKALALNPQTASFRSSYAEMLADEGRLFSAVAQARKAAQLAEQAGASRFRFDEMARAYADAGAKAYESLYWASFFKTADDDIDDVARLDMENKCLGAKNVAYANEYAYFWDRAGKSKEKADQAWEGAIAKALDFQTGCLKSIYGEFQTAYAKFQQDVKADYARAAQSWAALDVDCPSDPAACEAARSRGKASKAKLDAEIAAMPGEVKAKYDRWITGDNVRGKAERSRAAFLEKPGEYDYKGSWNYDMERSVAGFTGG